MNLHEISPTIPINPWWVLAFGSCRYNCTTNPLYRDPGNHHRCIDAFIIQGRPEIRTTYAVSYCECRTCLTDTPARHYQMRADAPDYICRPCTAGNHPTPR